MKRKREEQEAAASEKKSRLENWDLDDDLALVLLIEKYKFAWDQIKLQMQNHQHRRLQDTEKTLEKRWKNISANDSKNKYHKSKEFQGTPFKITGKTLDDIQLQQQEAIHREKVYL